MNSLKVATCLVFAGLATASMAFTPADPLAASVHDAYAKVATYSQASNPMSIEVLDFRKIDPVLIKYLPISEVLSPVDEMIRVTSRGYQDKRSETGEEINSFAFDASWVNVSGGASQMWSKLTMQQAIDMGAEVEPLESIQQMAAFQVRVTLQGRTITYKTLAWMSQDKDGTSTIRFLDQLFGPGVLTKALTENRMSRGDVSLAAWETPGLAACTSTTRYSSPQSQSWSSSDDHSNGRHYASSTVQIRCTYSSTCSNQCTPTVSFGGGDTFWDTIFNLHYFADDIHQVGGYSSTGSTTSCKAGYGAGVKYCFLIPCGVTVSLTLGSYGFTYSSGTDATKRASINQLSGSCPRL